MSRRRTSTGIPGLSFSWKRATGITAAKRRFARATGIPATRSGRQRKIGGLATGSGCGCLIPILLVAAALTMAACNGARAPTVYPRAATMQIAYTPGPLPTRTPRPVDPTAIPLPTGRSTRIPGPTVEITRTPRPTATDTTAAAPAATRTIAPASPTPSHAALFVRDVTIPDGTAFQPGTTFNKTWLFRNTGTAPWGDDVHIRHGRQTQLCAENEYDVPAAAPGQEVEITLPMRVPTEPGYYTSEWNLCAGTTCFGSAWVVIVSLGPPTPTVATRAPDPPIVIAPTAAPPPPAATCDCSGNNYNCPDFPTHSAAQACFDYCWNTVGRDVHGLDADDDGIACERNP